MEIHNHSGLLTTTQVARRLDRSTSWVRNTGLQKFGWSYQQFGERAHLQICEGCICLHLINSAIPKESSADWIQKAIANAKVKGIKYASFCDSCRLVFEL